MKNTLITGKETLASEFALSLGKTSGIEAFEEERTTKSKAILIKERAIQRNKKVLFDKMHYEIHLQKHFLQSHLSKNNMYNYGGVDCHVKYSFVCYVTHKVYYLSNYLGRVPFSEDHPMIQKVAE